MSTDPLRILMISGSYPPMKCGVGDYTAQLVNALACRPDTRVAVLADVAVAGCPSDAGVEIFPVAHGWLFSDVLEILRTARRWHPDIIHIQYPSQNYKSNMPWLLSVLLLTLGVPIVQTWHNYYGQTRFWHNLPNTLVPGGLVVVRPRYKENMPTWYRWLIAYKRFRYIPNASAIPQVVLTASERNAVRAQWAPDGRNLLVYFGFIFPPKGVDLLFDIADPARHQLVFIGDLKPDDPYHQQIREHARQAPWADRATMAGFLPADEANRILAAADAVVLPFREGGGSWNTSIQSAALQGTFVVTTSFERHGYDAQANIYYGRPNDVSDLRAGLDLYLGRRNDPAQARQFGNWDSIADAHLELYRSLLN